MSLNEVFSRGARQLPHSLHPTFHHCSLVNIFCKNVWYLWRARITNCIRWKWTKPFIDYVYSKILRGNKRLSISFCKGNCLWWRKRSIIITTSNNKNIKKMSGLETNLKSTRPRPGHYETKTETASKRPRPRAWKLGSRSSSLHYNASGKGKRGKLSAVQKDLHCGPSVPQNLER